MFLISIRHGVVLRARPLPMTYVAVAHHLRIRPINARAASAALPASHSITSLPPAPKGCMLHPLVGLAARNCSAQVFRETRFVTHKNTVNLLTQYSPLTTDKRGSL
jgi:hypothetical protein